MLDNKNIISKEILHSASLVDEKGHEVPITRDMINQAFEKIEKNLEQQRQRNQPC